MPPDVPGPVGVARRAVLGAALALGACRPATRDAADARDMPGPPHRYAGGWLGDGHARGHLVRETLTRSPDDTRRCAVAIVGGGIAGLAAARAVRAAGVEDLRVFELEDQPGGNARAHAIAGMACPQGAHYLPVPGAETHEVAQWLHEIGLLRHEFGRTRADERHLAHSPQERLWVQGDWVEGLLPPAEAGSARLAQYRRLASLVQQIRRELAFAIPTHRAPWTHGHAALDALTFADWLNRQGLDDPGLRWYLDYACRDDYGAGASTVSAWAGLHYFASRHGFHAPGDAAGERDAVFTWPEGNAWLVRRLIETPGDALRERVHSGSLVRRVDAGRHEVAVDVISLGTGRLTRWVAQQVVLGLPLQVAARVVVNPPPALAEAAARLPQAPWLVANIHLPRPLTDKPGAPPSWDNVLMPDTGEATPGLGYVDAMHQAMRPMPGPSVITTYWALGDGQADQRRTQRQALRDQPWAHWARRVVDDLARAHPDLPGRAARVDLTRLGHAMAVPVPGVRGSAALRALRESPGGARLHFAHADLAGYSIFEEAFTLGHAAGRAAAAGAAPAWARRRR